MPALLLCLVLSAGLVEAPEVRLHEVDPDQPGLDTADFVELDGTPGARLDGVFLVLHDGAAAALGAYDAVDLYGQRLGDDGLLLIGSGALDGVDLIAFDGDGLQNGPDGVALWYAPDARATDFIGRAPPADAQLLDALVYGGAAPALATQLGLAPDAGARVHDDGPNSLARAAAMGFRPASPSPGTRLRPAPGLRPHHVQGAGHLSPLRGQHIEKLEGVVTALRRDGFHLQTAPGEEDGLVETSEAVRVVVRGARRPELGERLRLSGLVEEARPGGRETALPRTQLRADETWEVLARGATLPAPIVLGPEGRTPPGQVIDDDTTGGQVGSGTYFDPANDGLDFWESLEAMRVRMPAALAVGPSNKYGDIPVILPPDGSGTPGMGADGRLRPLADDAQPEILFLDDTLAELPKVQLGARFRAMTGVLDHDHGAFRLLVREVGESFPDPPALATDVSDLDAGDALSVVSYNVENLAYTTSDERFAAIARHVVEALGSPRIVALQEIQDDSGPEDDALVSSRRTLAKLTEAIVSAGGPSYTALAIDPADGADGGQPGGNIRVAFLVDVDADLALPLRDGSATRAAVERAPNGSPRLITNPARLEPGHSAWNRSRKALVVELSYRGRPLFLVNLHLSSRYGDPSLFDALQPHVSATSAARRAQAEVVNSFVARLQAIDPAAAVIVLGDLNSFEGTPELQAFEADQRLILLTERIPPSERGTYIYQGRTQTLDHVLASPGLLSWDSEPKLRHLPLNTPFTEHASDHDPVFVAFRVPAEPAR